MIGRGRMSDEGATARTTGLDWAGVTTNVELGCAL